MVAKERWALGAILAATVVVYLPLLGFGFVNYDDGIYVVENARVREGLSFANLRWAFTNVEFNWHPLTWVSHLIDGGLFGVAPGGHHATSLALHLLNVGLLFLVLRKMTGAPWPSLCVAALFAIHPLNVESVAWVAERKNVLSTTFWFTTMGAYAWYVDRPGWKRYALVVLSFVCGLMCKSMLVTLPLLLLVLDHWPLARFGADKTQARRPFSRLLLEKVPLLGISVVASIITVKAQAGVGAMGLNSVVTLGARMENALVAYLGYVEKMFWPSKLAVLYPFSLSTLSASRVAVAVAFMVGVSLVCWRLRIGYLTAGWCWFLGTLVPVIGLVQVGVQSMADRYAYVPLIGLFLILVWSADAVIRRWAKQASWRIGAAGAVFGALAVVTAGQVQTWRNSITLFSHAIESTSGNVIARTNLATAYLSHGDFESALFHLTKARELTRSDDLEVPNRMATVRLAQGHFDEAIRGFHRTLELNARSGHRLTKNDYMTYNNLGIAHARKGDMDRAIVKLKKSLELNPSYFQARQNLAKVMRQLGN